MIPRVMAWLLCGVALLYLESPAPSTAKDRRDPISQRIEQEKRALEHIRNEIEDKRKKAEEAERQKGSALQSIQDLDDRLQLSRQERQQIGRQLKDKDREIEEINARVLRLHQQITDRRHSILTRMRVQYMEGRYGHLKALLAATNATELQQRYQYLSTLSRREYDLITAYEADVEQFRAIERQRTAAREEMLRYKKHTDQKLAEIHGLKREKRQVLVKLNLEKETYERAAADLERSAARVDSLLRELEQRRKLGTIRPPKDVAPGRASKGGLPWPAEGDVVSFFGRQKHPTFATYIQRKGIEIRTEEGSPIRVVMAGTIEYADWLKGYGQVIIVDHSNGFFSLYAHASKLLVKVGEHVHAGQVVGETGDTGLTGDSTLYFELREGAEAVDPLIWLAKRR